MLGRAGHHHHQSLTQSRYHRAQHHHDHHHHHHDHHSPSNDEISSKLGADANLLMAEHCLLGPNSREFGADSSVGAGGVGISPAERGHDASSFVVIHPYDKLNYQEVQLAELAYTEQVLGRRRLRLDNYISRRCEFLKENIHIQRAGILVRNNKAMRLRMIEKKKLSFLRDKQTVTRVLNHWERGEPLYPKV